MKIISEVNAHLDINSGVDKVYRRNASLAEVTNTFNYICATPQPYLTIRKPYPRPHGDKEADKEALDPWQSICQKIIVILKYADAHRDVYSTFHDMRTFVTLLVPEDRLEFLIRLARMGHFGIGELPFEQLNETRSAEKSCQAEYHVSSMAIKPPYIHN